MKRLAMALVLVAGLGVGAEAGSLPKPISLTERIRAYHTTHYVRGVEKGKGSGRSADSMIEARQTTPAPKPTPAAQPLRAD